MHKMVFNYSKVYTYLLIIIAALLPFTEYFSTQFISFAIILLVLFWAFSIDKRILVNQIKTENIIFLLIAVYFININ